MYEQYFVITIASLSDRIHEGPPDAYTAPGLVDEEEREAMLGKFMVCAMLAMLAMLVGCAEPQAEVPKANGAYLIIEGNEAWAVLIADGKRIEERGTVHDAIRLPKARSSIAASYVIDTPNCGRLQWLTEAEGDSMVRLTSGGDDQDMSACRISDGLSRAWTALDYSS